MYFSFIMIEKQRRCKHQAIPSEKSHLGVHQLFDRESNVRFTNKREHDIASQEFRFELQTIGKIHEQRCKMWHP